MSQQHHNLLGTHHARHDYLQYLWARTESAGFRDWQTGAVSRVQSGVRCKRARKRE
jgi:hypothetical protein